MHHRFFDLEGSFKEEIQHLRDGDSLGLRSSRRNELHQQNPLDNPRQSISDQIFDLSTLLESEDDTSLLSTLSSIKVLTENSDGDEVVTLIIQANIIDKLQKIVSSNENRTVLMRVYYLLARLTRVSVAVVSRIMVPTFLSKSLSLVSTADDDLTLNVLHVLYNSAVAGQDFSRFEVENGVTGPLLQYLLECQPAWVRRSDKSCCGRLELEERRKQTISKSLLLLTKLIKISFPDTLKHLVVTACVPYFLSRDRHVQLLALQYAHLFVPKSEMGYFLQFSLPNNQMNASDQTRIPVLLFLVDLLREKQMEYEQNVRAYHVFQRACADIRNQLKYPKGMTQPEPSCLGTVEGEVMMVLQTYLKTIGTLLAIFGELAYLLKEHEQIMRITGIYPLLGVMLIWSLVFTYKDIPPPLPSAEEDYEYFRTAVETNSQLKEPFSLLEPLRTAFRQLNLLPPLAYRDNIRTFIHRDIVDCAVFLCQFLGLKGPQDFLRNNLLFLLRNVLDGTPAHTEIVVSSLFPGLPATEATKIVISFLKTILPKLSTKSPTETMRCIDLLTGLPSEHQSVLFESEILQHAWNQQRDLDMEGARYLVHSTDALVQQYDSFRVLGPTLFNSLVLRCS